MGADGLLHCIALGDVLHHLALARLDWSAHHDAAALVVVKKGEDLLVDKLGHLGALGLEHGN